MKTKELRQLNDQELHGKSAEINQELMKERAQIAIGTFPKSPGKIKQMRKTIAKIKTILHERQSKQ